MTLSLSFSLSLSLCLYPPDEGYYQSGRFQFEINVPEAYNMVVSDKAFIFPALCLPSLSVYVPCCVLIKVSPTAMTIHTNLENVAVCWGTYWYYFMWRRYYTKPHDIALLYLTLVYRILQVYRVRL